MPTWSLQLAAFPHHPLATGILQWNCGLHQRTKTLHRNQGRYPLSEPRRHQQALAALSSLTRETPTHAHGCGAPRPGLSYVGGTPLPSPAPGCSHTITGISQTNLRPGLVSSPFAGSLTARRSVGPAAHPALSTQLGRCGLVPHWWWPCPARVGVAPQFPTLVDQPQSPNRSKVELTGLSVQMVCLATVSQGFLPLPG